MRKLLITTLMLIGFGLFAQNPISVPSVKQNASGANLDFKNASGIYNTTMWNMNVEQMSTSQMNSITTPKIGRLVHDTVQDKYCYYSNALTWNCFNIDSIPEVYLGTMLPTNYVGKIYINTVGKDSMYIWNGTQYEFFETGTPAYDTLYTKFDSILYLANKTTGDYDSVIFYPFAMGGGSGSTDNDSITDLTYDSATQTVIIYNSAGDTQSVVLNLPSASDDIDTNVVGFVYDSATQIATITNSGGQTFSDTINSPIRIDSTTASHGLMKVTPHDIRLGSTTISSSGTPSDLMYEGNIPLNGNNLRISGTVNSVNNEPVARFHDNGDVFFGTTETYNTRVSQFHFDKSTGSGYIGKMNNTSRNSTSEVSLSVGDHSTAMSGVGNLRSGGGITISGNNNIGSGYVSTITGSHNNLIMGRQGWGVPTTATGSYNIGVLSRCNLNGSRNIAVLGDGGGITASNSIITAQSTSSTANLRFGKYSLYQMNISGNGDIFGGCLNLNSDVGVKTWVHSGQSMNPLLLSNGINYEGDFDHVMLNTRRFNYTDGSPDSYHMKNIRYGIGAFTVSHDDKVENVSQTLMLGRRLKNINNQNSTLIGDEIENTGTNVFLLNLSDNTILGTATTSPFWMSNTTNDYFWVRATNGYRLETNLAGTSGVSIPSGGNSWVSISDKKLKTNFKSINGGKLLEYISKIEPKQYQYKSDLEWRDFKYVKKDSSIVRVDLGTNKLKKRKYVGYVAQDFHNSPLGALGTDKNDSGDMVIETTAGIGFNATVNHFQQKRIEELEKKVQELLKLIK